MGHAAGSAADIAIIGYDGRFPGADNPRALWRMLCDGGSGIRQLSAEELERHGTSADELRDPNYVRVGAVLKDVELFDAAFFGIGPREAELIDPQQRLFLEVCWTALEHAGYDPGGFVDRVGVFAGARTNTYLLQLLSHADILKSVGPFNLGLANDIGFMTTRLSHCLNLTGPSCAVQTACSTSLVAVHLAVRSLLAEECRVALAGGAAVNVPQVAGYLAEEGSVFARDGRCRVFDASARGTVFGSGVAVVVLKRLADALADRDCVHAVIKGSAINNDGSAKASFTAPAVRGQMAVIEDALRNAGVTADSIGYVEAHGTGTLLGDAIEVRALTKAYRKQTAREGYCGVGSVKTNLGHLDAAAGVTGLIKVVECLRHERLVPTLNYEQPNPQIDFEGSPFHVVTGTTDWARGEEPRRAAVSAFGVGGTNAHVIVQEAPPRVASGPSRPWQVLVWSGKTPEAMEQAGQQLAQHLRKTPDVPLADVAYTLQTGRPRLPWRRAAACRDATDAIAAIDNGAVAEQTGDIVEEPGVAFVFPGQGAQHAGMGKALYDAEPVFRDRIDQCADLLAEDLGLDLRHALYDDSRPERLHETWLAQPALFATEYALAALWESWGVRPAAMLGHSLGEYVAACVSGVLGVEDALHLVALRGRLMQEMSRGAMLAVEVGTDDIDRWLGNGVWLAAVNGTGLCTVGGHAPAIAELEETLRAGGHAAHRIRTSHAYHTPLMTGMVDRYVAGVTAIPRAPACIPYVSNVTGGWVTDTELADAAYWGRQVREPVQFARGLETLLADGERVVVEVGPGQGLARLIRRRGGVRVCASMGRGGQTDTEALLTALAQVWTAGADVDWRRFNDGERRHRVPLPTYPFQRKRYWIDPPAAGGRGLGVRAAAHVSKSPDVARWFWSPSWTLAPQAPRPAAQSRTGERWLVFADTQGLGVRLAATLRSVGADVVEVYAGAHWERSEAQAFTIDPSDPCHYRRLIDLLGTEPRGIEHVLHLWGVVPADQSPDAASTFEAFQAAGLHSLLHVARELTGTPSGSLRTCCVVANDAQGVESVDTPHAAKAGLAAFCKVLSQESEVAARVVDLASRDIAADLDRACHQVLQELNHEASEIVVAYRGRQRWRADYTALAIDDASAVPFSLRHQGVYVITGGLGAVGELIATQLAEECRARLVLTSRTALPPREQWPAEPDGSLRDPADAVAVDPHLAQAMRVVRAVEAAGGEVRVVAADASDPEAMRAVVQMCCTELGGLNGVIHAAGVTSGPSLFRTIRETTAEHCQIQAHPKVLGLYAIEQAIRDQPVDFVLAMSSNASVLGGLGFVSYAAANAAMDAFVAARPAPTGGTRWLSANWDHWPQETRKYLDVATSMDEYAMTRDEARTATRLVLTRVECGQVAVATGDLHGRLALWVNRPRPTTPAAGGGALVEQSALAPRPTLRTPYVAPANETEAKMAGIWGAYLGVSPVGTDDDFFEMGGHSLLAIQMIAEIGRVLGREVPLRALFEGPTVAQLADAWMRDPEHAAAVD